jgi:hypothetical protein
MIREIHTRGHNEEHCMSVLSTIVVASSVQLRDQALAGPKVSHASVAGGKEK